VNAVRQSEINTEEPLVSDPTSHEIEVTTEKWKYTHINHQVLINYG
jgi:hypothetical protein